NDVNSATERVTGYPRSKLIGTDFSDYFTDSTKARAGYQRVFQEGVVRDYELVIRHKDGHTTPVLYNASLYRDDGGSVIGVLATARDISERRHLEAQLRQSQKMEALGTLAGGVAHDFNNILAAIIGFSELAKDHMAEDLRERRYIERVLQSGIRGRELVRQMLQFSRKTDQERKPLLLSALVKEAVRLLRASIPSSISIKTTVKSESGVIMGDAVQIEQVLMNLSTNAAHAMREKGGVIEIELSDFSVTGPRGNSRDMEPGLYMKLVVRDTGSGIAAEIMDKIFDPFFTTKKTGEGTGLGLSVVMGIVKQANGYVTAESVPGKGSAFTVYLPKVEDESRIEQRGYEDIPTGQGRILFVDDEEALVEMGEDILAELGYEVVGRTKGGEALAHFRLDPARFDLVITDQTMPDMSGTELASDLLVLRPDIPIILITGFSHAVNEESARALGIKGFVTKPLTREEIAKTIRKVFDEKT
ncbi:MAG TPA: hybrid sensor histidine kinase/response regulator, partial [Deltaproteobacteria bacterium]|nr:hybrid sensor histidine kinase/response regulator [Deltaproteobacteria bacterium]